MNEIPHSGQESSLSQLTGESYVVTQYAKDITAESPSHYTYHHRKGLLNYAVLGALHIKKGEITMAGILLITI